VVSRVRPSALHESLKERVESYKGIEAPPRIQLRTFSPSPITRFDHRPSFEAFADPSKRLREMGIAGSSTIVFALLQRHIGSWLGAVTTFVQARLDGCDAIYERFRQKSLANDCRAESRPIRALRHILRAVPRRRKIGLEEFENRDVFGRETTIA